MELQLLSLNIGRRRVIAMLHGEPVLSAIDKAPITAGDIGVRRLGLEDDEQADLSVHGGEDKAVYAYPSENWRWWEDEKNLKCGPATFGENLTLSGADEDAVAIGDRFQWGDTVLEISQPRAPCFKLALHTRRPDVPGLLTQSARCGWYFRVLHEGRAKSSDRLTRTHRSNAASVRDTFRALYDPRADHGLVRTVFELSPLARAWKAGLARKIR